MSMTRTSWIPGAAILLAAAFSLSAGEPRDLVSLREKYDKQVRAAMQPAFQSYVRDLEALLMRLTSNKDFEGARFVQEELGRARDRLASLQNPVLAPPAEPVKEGGDNRVVNPGFEDGGTAGWYLVGLDAKKSEALRSERQSHGGRYCLRMQRAEGEAMGIALQDLFGRVKGGERIQASAWIWRTSGGADSVSFGVALKEATGDKTISTVAQPVLSAGKWERVTFEFTVPTREQAPKFGAVHFYVLIAGKADPGEVFVDDVQAVAAPR
jgi:hypothetical protein